MQSHLQEYHFYHCIKEEFQNATTANQQCYIATNFCGNNYLYCNYSTLTYCLLDGNIIVALISSALIGYMVYNAISEIINEHLTPSLDAIKQKFEISDVMAGVTIIAFGNGAGDVITALVAASYPGGLDYNIGATNGANFFLCSVGVYLIVKSSKGPIKLEPTALWRNVGFQVISIFVIMFFGVVGEISVFSAIMLFVLYLLLIALVYVQEKNRALNSKRKIPSVDHKEQGQQYDLALAQTFDEQCLIYLWDMKSDIELAQKPKKWGQTLNRINYLTGPAKVKMLARKLQTAVKMTVDIIQTDKKKWSTLSLWQKIETIFFFPLFTALKYTLPPCKADLFDKTHTIIFPIPGIPFMISVLFSFPPWWAYFFGLMFAFLLSLVLNATIPFQKTPPSYFFYLQLISAFGSLIWIYFVSGLFLDFLQFWQLITKLNKTYLGFSLIAIVNVLPDCITLVALAEQGYALMALQGIYWDQLVNYSQTQLVSLLLFQNKLQFMVLQSLNYLVLIIQKIIHLNQWLFWVHQLLYYLHQYQLSGVIIFQTNLQVRCQHLYIQYSFQLLQQLPYTMHLKSDFILLLLLFLFFIYFCLEYKMFLNADNFDNEPQPQSNRAKQRFASNRFQAKQSNEAPKEPPKDTPVSRIQQKQMEIQKQPQVVDFQIETPTQQQQEQEQVQQESILNFDSDEDDSTTQNLIIEQRNQQQLQQLAYQQKMKESNFGVQQNQIYFNSSQKYGDEDIDLNKLTYAGNNHNKPHEPGQQFEEHDLPQLKKEDQKQILQQSYVKFLDEQQKKSESESDDEEHHHNLEKMEQLEQNQMIKKELQQQNEKVLVEEEHEVVQESQEIRMEQEEPQQTKSLCPYPKAMTNVPMPDGKKYFLTNPCPQGGMIQCTIKRDKSGFGRFYPSYHIHFSNGFMYLMSAKKRACNNTSNYLIAMTKSDMTAKQNFLGKVRSNFIGTEFILYDSGKNPKKTKHPEEYRQQLGVVLYESNILGSKGPRKMQVLLPKVDSKSGQPYIYKPASSKDGILKDFRDKNMKNLVSYINRPPQWNSKHKAFVLNFYQRVDKPSVKNFQLVVEDGEDNILLQFGRVGTDLFNLDFQYPLSPLQAFEIALSSFDYKIACE